jgi:hypothetical protein
MDTQQFTLGWRAVGTLLRIDPRLNWVNLEIGGCACSHMIEIGRPYGPDQVSLGEMTQEAISNVRTGFADDVREIGASVIRYRKALPDVEAVFLGRVFFRKATLMVKPTLNSAAHAVE